MKTILNRTLRLLLFAVLILPFLSADSHASDYSQVNGLIDLRSTFSDGAYSIERLVRMAKNRGFEVVVINDHDRMVMEYGLPPFRNIVKKRVERPSINKIGAKAYLDSIKSVREKYPDMIIIPGSETAAFYYWTGSYFKKNLTAHNHERRILTIGMETPEDYENLPILHNGFSTEYILTAFFGILVSSVFIVASIFLVRKRGFLRKTGLIFLILSVAFLFNLNPFKSSPFDQYHGDQGMAPYQLLIDYVNSKGGLTFWNYPETASGCRRLGPITVETLPCPEVLEKSEDYTGFAALYGDNITVTEPGDIWDRVLTEYCKGTRSRPVWGIATADYHEEGGAGEKLGKFPTVFLVRKKTREAILQALKNGKMYTYQGECLHVKLDEFSVSSLDGGIRGISGDEIVLKGNPKIDFSISEAEASKNRVKVRLIRSGKILKTFEGTLPIHIEYEDKYFQPGETIFYRIDMKGCGNLVSNPIFVTFNKGGQI